MKKEISGPKPFRIFDVWLDEDDVEEVIKKAWYIEVPVIERKDCMFRNKLKNVKNGLKEWSKKKFNNLDEKRFDEKEVRDAILDCASNKAPGTDGFNLRFFKKYWEIIKHDLDSISWFWEKGEISRGCNSSFVTLIPKIVDPQLIVDYRPISLISSYYKIIAKLLSNHLRNVIPSLVGLEQSAFLKGRFIHDGALIVNECIDFLKWKKQKGFIFKVGFEKAFDSINWDFLFEVMRCMRFGSKWCKWIHACLASASISILVNGPPTIEFSLGRGVRQGDPLSPFLFILAAEDLNIFTKNALDKELFSGIEVGGDKVPVSDLQYADDTIFFGEFSRTNARNLQNLLMCFELASGLKVNFNKSCVYGIEMSDDELILIANQMGCRVGEFSFTYLGLPIGYKMTKMKDLNPVIENIKNRLSCWKMRSMSYGGRLVLIKSILSNLPLYFLLLFRAPQCVLKLLENVRQEFFWGGTESGTKISWWWWRFYTETDSLWNKVIRSIYGSCGGLRLGGDLGYRPTLGTWKNIILAGNSLEDLGNAFKHSFKKEIGNGSSTSFWNDIWLGDNKLSVIFPRLYRLETDPTATVEQRLSSNGPGGSNGNWAWARAPTGRVRGELDDLLQRVSGIQCSDREDKYSWVLDNNKNFTVKKLSGICDEKILPTINNNAVTLRNNLVPKKIEIFIWRLMKKRLPVRIELDKRGIDLHSVRCPVCDDGLESTDHTLPFCSYAFEIWNRVYSWWGLGAFSNLGFNEILRGQMQSTVTSNRQPPPLHDHHYQQSVNGPASGSCNGSNGYTGGAN
ncbi:uncharacterized protein [Rutidosis leptorrhynchoides]|uniref:uncharacterized protein n=1 Tax=Rutidosis leptorrhynchoides TaxID=125765 RepID=UPI003A9A5397